MRRLSLATPVLIAAGLALCAPAQAAAPASSGEKVNMVIIFGEDACPASTGNEITVCARKDEAERFRIPAPLREATTPQNDAWNNKVIAYETVGSSGAQSCSAAGSARSCCATCSSC